MITVASGNLCDSMITQPMLVLASNSIVECRTKNTRQAYQLGNETTATPDTRREGLCCASCALSKRAFLMCQGSNAQREERAKKGHLAETGFDPVSSGLQIYEPGALPLRHSAFTDVMDICGNFEIYILYKNKCLLNCIDLSLASSLCYGIASNLHFI